MDPVDPWLDADEVRRLAARLVGPRAAAPMPAAPDAGFDPGFVGFTNDPSSSGSVPDTFTADTPAIPQHAPPAIPAAPPVAPAPSPPTGIRAGAAWNADIEEWMRRHHPQPGFFILDGDGKVLCDAGGHTRLHFLARGATANVRVRISASSMLEIIPADTPRGRIVAGVLAPQALPASAVRALAETMARASGS